MSPSPALPDASEQRWFACDRPSRWIVLLTVAIAVRGLALWQFGGQLANDPDAYRDIANNLVEGRGFGFTPGQANGSPSAYRPPLYPLLLALITWGSGGSDEAFRRTIALVQLLIGTGTVAMLVSVARQLRFAHASLLVGLLAALDPVLIYNTALVMTETTATFLVTLLFWLGLRARGSRGWFATGIVFGLCCLCRPTFWAFGGLFSVGWLLTAWRDRSVIAPVVERRPGWSSAAAVGLGAILTVAPWVVRNAVAMGKPILTTTHGGYTLLLGHNPIYTEQVVNQSWGAVWQIDSNERWTEWLNGGMQEQNPPIDLRQPPSPAVELARDRWMSRTAWQYMRDDPGTAVRSSLTLWGRFWNVVPMLTTNRTIAAPLRGMIGVSYTVVFTAVLAGLIRIRRDEWSRWWPALALILSFTAVHGLYWADLRMRAPLVPVLALLAGRGLLGVRGGDLAARHNSETRKAG